MKSQFLLFIFVAIITLSCGSDDSGGNGPLPTGYTQYGTPFANMPANEDAVIYEVNLRAFSNAGNIQGVIARLNEIKALGVNTIWLMPIYPDGEVNSVNSPYAVKDYKGVGAEYGSLADLRALTTAAHNLNMSVILDWVANHTSWDNSWITAHPNWYTQDGNGNIQIPAGTNWNDVADLNFNNQEMRLEMIDAMKYWVLEANVDGFRCDYADGVPFDFWSQAITALNAIPNRDLFFLAEGSRADHFTAGFDLNYGWDYYGATKNVWNGQSAMNLYNAHVSEYAAMPAGKEKIRFTTNHDESAWDDTPVGLFNGVPGAFAASVQMIFMGGVPLFYTGQEVGTAATVPFFSNSPIDWNTNPDMLASYKDVMQLYTTNDEARKGTVETYSSSDVSVIKRAYNGESMLILVNVRNSVSDYIIPAALQQTQWTNMLTDEPVTLETNVLLNEYGYLILKSQ